jgi:hypothetical protein
VSRRDEPVRFENFQASQKTAKEAIPVEHRQACADGGRREENSGEKNSDKLCG